MEKTALIKKVLKGHERQVKLSHRLATVGYNTPFGKLLRLKAYYSDGFVILKAWRDFLFIRKDNVGDPFLAVDQAIMHADHEQVKRLMHVEPQVRGNDLGIIRILAPSYLLNNPLSLGTNGQEHDGLRAVFQAALPDPFEDTALLGQWVDHVLTKAADKGSLQVGDDIPRFILEILHQLVFGIALSEEEISASRSYIKGLALASLPNFVSRYLLWPVTKDRIAHRKKLTQKYQKSPRWATYIDIGKQHGLSAHQVVNGLFDMIHIAGTAGTSALLGSVIGVMCMETEAKEQAIAEVADQPLSGDVLRQATVLHRIVLETARLYPPVRFVSQLSTTSGEVTVGQQKCPFQKGTRLLGSIFTANRDGQRYDNPDTFSIERDFSDLLSWNGAGHERVCPGQSLSIELIKIFCIALFQNYQWQQSAEIEWDFENVTAVTPNTLTLESFTRKA